MSRTIRYLASLVLLCTTAAQAGEGLIARSSPFDAKTTMDKFEAVAKGKGMTIFARINHAAGAAKVGQALRPTEVLIFGNPKGGTPFMQCAQTIGIDLPLKLLVWQDEDGKVWLAYNDPAYIAKRHDGKDCDPVVERLTNNLAAFVAEALDRSEIK